MRLQRGPQGSVGRIPNMLAPLSGREPALNRYYPQDVMKYLQSVPPTESPASGSPVEQLMAEWTDKTGQQISRLASSLDDKTKLSIDDLSDRMAMLSD